MTAISNVIEDLLYVKVRADHNDNLDLSQFRLASCQFYSHRQFDYVFMTVYGFESSTQYMFLDSNYNDRFCVAVRQDEDVNVSWYLTYGEQEMKHYIGWLDLSTGKYKEKGALYAWTGYADNFDFQSSSFYARMD